MGGLAALARECGHTVTGCDAGVYPPMSGQLRALGIELIEGYDRAQLDIRPDVFVIGNVVSRARLPDGAPKFPLMEAILDAGAPYISGPQWLAENVLQGRHVLAVAGTHGKTSTASMLAWILECAGMKPGFLIGGVPLNFGISARLGEQLAGKPRPFFVIEADEYDTAFFDKRSKFVHYRPRTLVLNNLEFDHADIFDNLAAIERQFQHLLRTVPVCGQVIVNAREPALERVLQAGVWSELAHFGTDDSQWRASGEASDFEVQRGGHAAGRVRWALTGAHNQLNALAAIAAAAHAGVPPEQACAALETFQNVRRRMEVRGSVGGVTVYDDFAHHPTAIRTTVDGLRRRLDAGGRSAERILAIFEPRSNTMRLGAMKERLPWALENAAQAFCYAAHLDWDAAAALAPLGARAVVAHSVDELVQRVLAATRPGDHLLCMSNGGFEHVHERLLEALAAQQ